MKHQYGTHLARGGPAVAIRYRVRSVDVPQVLAEHLPQREWRRAGRDSTMQLACMSG